MGPNSCNLLSRLIVDSLKVLLQWHHFFLEKSMLKPFQSSLLALSLLACGGGETVAGEEAGSPVPVADVAAAGAPADGCVDSTGAFDKAKWVDCAPTDSVAVSVIGAGSGEMKALRISADAGHEENNRMSMDIKMSMSMGPMGAMDMPLPTMIIDMNTKVLSVADNGDLTSTVEVVAIDVGEATGMMAGMEGELKATLQEMVGLKGEVVTSSTGFVVSGGFEAPPNASKEVLDQLKSMNDSLGNSSVPVPTEPIAPGAVWETLMRDQSNGMDIVQHGRAELKGWEGDDALIEMTLTQMLADMSPALPDMPPGAEVEIKRFESSGSGNVRMRTGFVNPVDATSTVHLEMQMNVKAEGQEMDMDMTTDLTANFKQF
jgi:hypothetical protein